MDITPALPRSVMIVEDEQIVALDLQEDLEEMGFRVVGTAASGDDAIHLARQHRPDVVLMDIVLRGSMDGIEAARLISHEHGTPVIFLTAYSDTSTVMRAAETAPFGYLTKPYQSKELRAAIEVALVKSALERRLRESERWFASTLRCVGDAVIATDPGGIITFLNPVAEKITGWSVEDAQGRAIEEVMPLASSLHADAVPSPARQALEKNKVVDLEHGALLVGRDGRRTPIDDSAAPIRDDDGRLLGCVVVLRDVTERQRQERLLRDSEERFRNVFELAAVGMALVALDGRILQANDAFCALLGRERNDLLSRTDTDLTEPADRARERSHLYELLTDRTPAVQFEKRYHCAPKGVRWVLASVSLLQEHGQAICYVYQIHDLTERKSMQYELERMAYFDPLTGLSNRAHLRQELERQIAEARRHGHQFAVLFIDLDRFKSINDTLGHEAGDELLRGIGERLRTTVRETDCVARLGGDEFVIALTDVHDASQVKAVTEKIRLAVGQPMELAGRSLVVTPSIGVSLYPDDGADTSTLLRNADSALYAAKAEGRNRVHFFKAELGRLADERLDLEAALRRAITENELFLEYQPIVRLADRVIVGVEALVRWRRDGAIVSPAKFIPIAEETGLIVPLGDWVLREACRAGVQWPSLLLHVNCSPRQFREDTLPDAVGGALDASGFPARRLCLEITENTMLQTSDAQIERIARLQALGISLSIDDYGTGYSSLSYIKRYAPGSLKIDRFFVSDLDADASSAAIVSATIAMAHDLGLEVVAEGIETETQRALLEAEHCDHGQGFLFSRPVSAEAIAELVRSGLPRVQPEADR